MHTILKNNLVSISFATSLSKVAGFVRQIFIAAAFGIGITYDAFNYAYIIPGFLLIIIGGINGPLHNAVVAVITPLNKRDSGIVLTKVGIKLTLLFFIIGLIISFVIIPHCTSELIKSITNEIQYSYTANFCSIFLQ